MYHITTNAITNRNIHQCAGTVAARDILAMRDRSHPIYVALDGLLRLAAWNEIEMGSKIAEDSFTGPYWLASITNLRGMFSSASPKGFDVGTCEAIFWRAMDYAGFTEADM